MSGTLPNQPRGNERNNCFTGTAHFYMTSGSEIENGTTQGNRLHRAHGVLSKLARKTGYRISTSITLIIDSH